MASDMLLRPPSKRSASGRESPARMCAPAMQLAGARQRHDMRVAVRSAAVEAIEERVAIGLEPVDVASALLLGHSCRFAEPAEIALINHSATDQKRKANVSETELEHLVETSGEESVHSPSGNSTQVIASDLDALPPLPSILLTGQGSEVVPIPNEYARLEGYHWMHTESCGKGSVFCIERFGNRGECILCPAFCAVRPASSEPYLEAEGSSMHWPVNCLQRVLEDLCHKVKDLPRVAPENYLKIVEKASTVVLVVPAGKLMIKPDPSAYEFCFQAVRRHTLYIDSVEMGAKLSICAVPLADTQTGDLDKSDADLLQRHLGATVFSIAGQRSRLCFRHLGGPQLDGARVSGKTLNSICTYIQNGWSDSLGAMPTTWVRLSIGVAHTTSLEEALSSPGMLVPVNRKSDQNDTCCYCGDSAVVGYEVLQRLNHNRQGRIVVNQDGKELDFASGSDCLKPLCSLCSGFVQGILAPVTKLISESAEPVDIAAHSGMTLRDHGDFSALSVKGLHLWSDMLARRKALQTESSNNIHQDEEEGDEQTTSQFHSEAKYAANSLQKPLPSSAGATVDNTKISEVILRGWEDSTLPSGAVVLAVSMLISLICPPEGFEKDELGSRAKLENEICHAIGCRFKTAQIVAASPEPDTGGLALSVMILHPATMDEAISSYLGKKRNSIEESAEEDLGPLAPLLLYRRLAEYLALTLKGDADLEKQLVVGDASRAIAPCSIVFCPGAHSTAETNNGADPDQLNANCEEEKFDLTLIPDDLKPFSTVEETTFQPSDQSDAQCEDDSKQVPTSTLEVQEPPSMAAIDTSSPNNEREETTEGMTVESPKSPKSPKILTSPKSPTSPKSLEGATSPPESPSSPRIVTPALSVSSNGNALFAMLSSFNPTTYQLALRLRELAAAHLPKRCRRLLSRWGNADMDGGSKCATAVVSRDAQRFGGQSALDLAIVSGDRATMDALLDFVPDCREGTPQYESREEISRLINTPNPMSGYTALYAMTLYPNEHTKVVVERLVQRRADINVCGHPTSLPVEGMAQTCLDDPNAAFVRLKETPLVVATRRGDETLIRKLIELGADVNAKTVDGVCILQTSIERGDRDILQALVDSPHCNLNETDTLGRTALVTALRLGCVDLAKDLLVARCDADARDRNGAAPILHAIKVHDCELSRLLLESCADKDAKDPADGSHVLHLAAQTRNLPLIEALLVARADLHARHSREGRTALHFAAASHMPSVAEMLIDLRADVDACSRVGDTPLRLAVALQELDTIEVLCKGRADPNRANKSGCAPIHAAVSSGDSKLTELLVAYGADVHLADSRRWRPIHYGASCGNGNIVESLISSRANPYVRSFHGRTARDLGQSSATTALSQAAILNPPPPALLEPGPKYTPRLETMWKAKQTGNTSSIIDNRSVKLDRDKHAENIEDTSAWTHKANDSFAPQLSVQSMTESSMSSILPPIAMASKVRAGGTPRGSLRSGDMRLRLIGTGCSAKRRGEKQTA